VAIQQKNFFRAHLHDGAAKLDHHLDVRHLAHAERSRKCQVMGRVARPERRQAQNFIRALLLDATRDRGDDIGIRRQRQVRSVLFERSEREQHDFAARPQFLYFGPC
jgi:hypothetical protein